MKNKFKLWNILCLISCILLIFAFKISIPTFALDQENIVYKSATEYDYPPFSVVTNGEADGFSVELLKAVANEVGLIIEFKVDNWDTIKSELEKGELDILPIVGYSEERDTYFDFTVPYIVMRGNIFVRNDYTDINSEDDLFDKEIIVMRGDNSQEYAENMGFTDKLILVDTYTEAFELLSSGAHDAVLAQSLVGLKLINDLKINNIEAVTQLSDNGVDRIKVSLEGFEQKFSFAVVEGDKELLAKLNEGLVIVSENGKYEELYNKWFPFLVENKIDYTRIAIFFFIAILVIIFAAGTISIYIIRKEVKKKTAELENNAFRSAIMFNTLNQEYSSISDWYDYVLNEMIKMTGSEFGYIYLFNEEKNELELNSCSEAVMKESLIVKNKTVYHLEDSGFLGDAIRQRKSIIINDFSQEKLIKNGYPESHVKFKKWMGIPIFEENKIVALVGLANRNDDYNENDIRQVTTLMSGVWNLIVRTKYRNDLKSSEKKYRLITENGSDIITIFNITKNNHTYISPSVEKIRGFSIEEVKNLKFEEAIAADLVESTKTIITQNINDFLHNPHSTNNYRYETRQSCKNGQYIWVEISTFYQYNEELELETVNSIRNIEERKKSEVELKHLSYHDQLTNLYNRRFYEEELMRLDTERNLPIALIMADVNGLKLTNDAFGHQEGDELLKNIAQIFKRVCRSDEIISRIGGDEFVILLPKCDDAQAKLLIDRLNVAISNNKKMNALFSVSIGYAVKESTLKKMDVVFKEAEDDMYRHKLAENLSMRSKNIDLIMNSLFEKSQRERVHSDRVAEICEKIAINMNIDQEGIQQIKIAAVLHDIGKIGISDSILNKKGKLDNTEWEEMKKHSVIGYRILNTVPEFSEIAEFVLSHQERWDGKGYPNNLKGEDIPLQARIIAIADAFDAMTVKRSYRDAMSETDAGAEIKKYAGTQFDKDIARIFVEKVMKLPW